MFNSFAQLPEMYQGILYVLSGSIVLLYALGIIEKGVTILVIALALSAIIVGCMKMGLLKKASSLINQDKKQ